MAQIPAHKACDARLGGQLGDVSIQIHPVNALQFQDDMFALEFGDILFKFMAGSGWAFVTPLYGDTASLRGNYPAAMPRCSTGAVLNFFHF